MLPSSSSIGCSPVTIQGYNLLESGIKALADVEAAGMRVNVAYLEKQVDVIGKKIRKVRDQLQTTEIWARWRKRFGAKAKITSGSQLAVMLFEVLGYKATMYSKSGGPSTDEAHLMTIDSPFVRGHLYLSKLLKLRNTYLRGIQRETMDGYLHPFFNLHIARTFRSSSDSPNFQNMPIRNPHMGKIIRQCIIPRPGHVLVESDYSGVEVRVAACYHKDPVMLKYIRDPSKDMHRDMSMECYLLPIEEVAKAIRNVTKNKFVFPEFYGDYYVHCAESMWRAIKLLGLQTTSGIPLLDWLHDHGIHECGACDPKQKPVKGTFEYHMKAVENDFWNVRFKVYNQWKKDWYAKYLERGYFDTLTGFRISGKMDRKQVINYPVQGSAFHFLLWSLIQMVREIQKRKMRSRIIGQIHDSKVGDVHLDELTEYLLLTRSIMVHRVKGFAPWLNVPLDIEADVTPLNGSWYLKQPIKFLPNNQFQIEHPITHEKKTSADAKELVLFISER